MTKFSIFNGRTNTTLLKAETLQDVARIHLRRTIAADGYKFNDLGISQYLQSWIDEGFFENSDVGIITDFVASHLCWSNIHFLQDNVQISSDDLIKIELEILRILDEGIHTTT